MSWASSLLGTGNKKTTTNTTTGVDPNSQAYIDKQRAQAAAAAPGLANGTYFGGPTNTFMQGVNGLLDPHAAAQGFMDPYQKDVVDASVADFARQRQGALVGGAQTATNAGAFGGSRQAILQGQLVGDVNRNEASTLANLRSTGWNNAQALAYQNSQGLLGAGQTQGTLEDQVRQNPIFAQNASLGVWNTGMGPTGTSTNSTTTAPGSGLGGLVGTAMGAWNLYKGIKGGGGAGAGTPGASFTPPSAWQPPQWNPSSKGLIG